MPIGFVYASPPYLLYRYQLFFRISQLVTSADMKAEDVDQATPRTLTLGQRVATWS